MSLKSIVNKAKETRGFTIVELLIVIVVIGILATITIVAYNGVTDRAKTSSAQAAAKTIINKAAIFQAETGSYPTALTALTGADSDTSYYIPDGSITAVAGIGGTLTMPDTPQKIVFCTYPSAAGVAVGYWDYTEGEAVTCAATTYTVGDTTSGSPTQVPAPQG